MELHKEVGKHLDMFLKESAVKFDERFQRIIADVTEQHLDIIEQLRAKKKKDQKGGEDSGFDALVQKHINLKKKKVEFETTFDQDVFDYISSQVEHIS